MQYILKVSLSKNMIKNDGKCAFLPEEIEMWNSIRDLGFVDSWRLQNPDEDSIYSWFDYRSRMFER